MKNKKQNRSYYNHSLISLFVFISPIVLLLLSSYSVIMSISLHNTAWAIPNKLLINNNNTASNSKSNNATTTSLTSSTSSPTSIDHPPVANAGVNQTVNEKSTVV